MLSYLFRFRTPYKQSSRARLVTSSGKDSKNEHVVQYMFSSFFYPKNQMNVYTQNTLEAPKVLYFADQTQHFQEQT